MKRFISLLIISTFAMAVVSAQLKQNVDAAKTETKVTTAVIKVPTLVCGSCVTTVTNALKKFDGVTTAKVDLKKKTATVKYASSKVSIDKLEKAISEAGYDANTVKRNPEAYEKLDACCKVDTKK